VNITLDKLGLGLVCAAAIAGVALTACGGGASDFASVTPGRVITNTPVAAQHTANAVLTAQSESLATTAVLVQTPAPTPDLSKVGLYQLDRETGELTRLSSSNAYAPAWSPDGASIWYATSHAPRPGTDGAPAEVRAIDIATGEDSLVFTAQIAGGFFSIAPGARRAAYTVHAGGVTDPSEGQGGRVEYRVRIIDADGVRDIGSGLAPLLNASGTFVAFGSPSCSEHGRTRVVDLSTGESREKSGGTYDFVRWVNERELEVLVRRAEGMRAITRVDAVTGVEREHSLAITIDVNGRVATSPNGAAVLATSGGRVWIETGSRFMALPGQSAHPIAWSGDGRFAAYEANRVVYVVSGVDGAVTNTLDGEDHFGGLSPNALAWSPDGRRLLIAVSHTVGRGTCS
jgi:sugar lactone lactonase YvrE